MVNLCEKIFLITSTSVLGKIKISKIYINIALIMAINKNIIAIHDPIKANSAIIVSHDGEELRLSTAFTNRCNKSFNSNTVSLFT